MIRTAIILAGGLGTRLRTEVSDLPKSMAPIDGRPFLSYLLDYWLGQGVRRFILSVGYMAESIQNFFGDSYRSAEIEYSHEKSPLGTGGALLKAVRVLGRDEHFLLLNGDTYFAVCLEDLKKQHITRKADVTMAVLDVFEYDRYGTIEMDTDDKVNSFDSSSPDLEHARINGGVYLMRTSLFNGFMSLHTEHKISLEEDLLPQVLSQGKLILGFPSPGNFIDIGIPKDYKQSQKLLPSLPLFHT